MRARIFAVAVIALATFGGMVLCARHIAAQKHVEQTLPAEIAHVEARVDAYEAAALSQAGHVYPGSPEAVIVLGKSLFFDKHLSVNGNTACGFCHLPETGFQGGIEIINRTTVDQPGSVRTRFSLRKPP